MTKLTGDLGDIYKTSFLIIPRYLNIHIPRNMVTKVEPTRRVGSPLKPPICFGEVLEGKG